MSLHGANRNILDPATMRRLFAASPGSLPQIWAHPTAKWKDDQGAIAPPRVDSKSNIHMAILDLLALKQELPIEYEERRGDVLIFVIALKPHHLEGGVNDRGKPAADGRARHAGLRERLGFDPVSGAPIDKSRQPKIVFNRKRRPGLRVGNVQ